MSFQIIIYLEVTVATLIPFCPLPCFWGLTPHPTRFKKKSLKPLLTSNNMIGIEDYPTLIKLPPL